MTYILITPVQGTARSIHGTVLTSGVHYMLVRRDDVEVRNALTQLTIEAVENFTTEKYVAHDEIRKLVEELQLSRKPEDGETYADYRKNLYLYAIEALTSEGEAPVEAVSEVEPQTTRRTRQKTDSTKTTD